MKNLRTKQEKERIENWEMKTRNEKIVWLREEEILCREQENINNTKLVTSIISDLLSTIQENKQTSNEQKNTEEGGEETGERWAGGEWGSLKERDPGGGYVPTSFLLTHTIPP